MSKKLTDKVKVERIKAHLIKALIQIRDNSNRVEALGYVTTAVCQSFAILESDKDDDFAITHLWIEIQKEVTGEKQTQLQLPGFLGALGDKPKSKNNVK